MLMMELKKGAGSVKFKRYVKELIIVNKVDLLIIVEPRISGETADKVIKQLGFDGFAKVDAVGFSGGIWVLWKNSIGTVQVIAKESQILTVIINGAMGKKWGLSAIYASPTPLNRTLLWSYLKTFDAFDNMPWVLIGDFNQICTDSEKRGGLPESKKNMAAFLEVFSIKNLIDLGAQGTKFTWSNEHKDGSLILKRLDRVLCNLEWRHLFPDAVVQYGAPVLYAGIY
ncbi:hypothetical protein REPUB_Repub01dG0236100 [Reevesia pubescens]